jgi:hypothetical protein
VEDFFIFSLCTSRGIVTFLTASETECQRRQGLRWEYKGEGSGEGTLFVTKWIEGWKADSLLTITLLRKDHAIGCAAAATSQRKSGVSFLLRI